MVSGECLFKHNGLVWMQKPESVEQKKIKAKDLEIELLKSEIKALEKKLKGAEKKETKKPTKPKEGELPKKKHSLWSSTKTKATYERWHVDPT